MSKFFVATEEECLIPDETTVKALITSASWVEGKFPCVRVEYLITQRDSEYKGRTITQKLRYLDPSPRKAKAAKDNIFKLDGIGKGLLKEADDKDIDITGDNSLITKSIVGISVIACIGLYEIVNVDPDTGVERTNTGNYIKDFNALPKATPEQQTAAEKPQAVEEQSVYDFDFDDDIPF